MICSRSILVLACLVTLFHPLMAQDLIVGEPSCLDVVHTLRLPVHTGNEPESVPGAEWLEVDRTLAEVRSSLQGRQCRLKFRQIFEGKGLAFFPLTSRLLAEAPQRALTGLEVWASSGERLGTLEGRSTIEVEMGPHHRIYTFYYPEYRDQSGRLILYQNQLLQGELRVRWDDLRDRIAITTLSEDLPTGQLAGTGLPLLIEPAR